jgi:nucleoporin NUP82
MPKIKSYAPGWLNEPGPGHKLFAASTEDTKAPTSSIYQKKAKPGPRRTIARRGTEIFVAARREIRWGDLVYLKESWESKHSRNGDGVRIKREDADSNFEIYEDEQEGSGLGPGFAEGYRVSFYVASIPTDQLRLTDIPNRRSRHRSQMISGSL